MGERTWPGLGLPCYLPVPSGKVQRLLGLRGCGAEPALTAFPHTMPVRSSEAPASGQGQTAEYLGSKLSDWGSSPLWRPGYLGSGFCWVLLREVTSFPEFVAEVPYTKLPKGTSGFLTAHPPLRPCADTVTTAQPTPQPGEAWVQPGPEL